MLAWLIPADINNSTFFKYYPDIKVHWANMGPSGPMNFALSVGVAILVLIFGHCLVIELTSNTEWDMLPDLRSVTTGATVVPGIGTTGVTTTVVPGWVGEGVVDGGIVPWGVVEGGMVPTPTVVVAPGGPAVGPAVGPKVGLTTVGPNVGAGVGVTVWPGTEGTVDSSYVTAKNFVSTSNRQPSDKRTSDQYNRSWSEFLFCFVFVCLFVFQYIGDIVHLTHGGRDKMAAIFQTTFSNAFSWMKIFTFWLRFHWSLFTRVQLTIFQHWFR